MARNISVYLSYLLRHRPEKAHLDMDVHGYVKVEQLVDNVCRYSKYTLTTEQLKNIAAEDSKGRYCFSSDNTRIKCCQGHSIPWIEPEFQYIKPPRFLYHGTTADAYEKIRKSGEISPMDRQYVHLQADEEKAWQSAKRWNKTPVVLKTDVNAMYEDGYIFGMADNGVWCTKTVPTKYVCETIYGSADEQ